MINKECIICKYVMDCTYFRKFKASNKKTYYRNTCKKCSRKKRKIYFKDYYKNNKTTPNYNNSDDSNIPMKLILFCKV